MPPKCPNIKQEYEVLKQKKVEFVLACEKTGNVDALSKSELNKLKKLKRTLEEARDALKDRIEPYETRILKNTLESAINAVYRDGPHQGKSVKDLLQENNFRENIVKNIIYFIEIGSIRESEVSMEIHVGLGVGILTKNDVEGIYELVKKKLDIGSINRNLIKQQAIGDEWKEMQDHFWTFGAVLEFGTNRKELLGREAFQERIIEDVKVSVEKGQTSYEDAMQAARMLYAIKRLIVLSRRHRQRDGELKK